MKDPGPAFMKEHEAFMRIAIEEARKGYSQGEVPVGAVVVIDAVARLIPGVLGDERSSVEESFSNGLLEAPAYTKPNVFRGMAVPDILLGGNHPAIEKWKHGKSLERTRLNRPDLWRAWLKAHPEDAVE